MERLKVYSCFGYDELKFYEESHDFAVERLKPEYSQTNPLRYVRDKVNNVICFVGLGGHLTATVFLLREFYGLSFYEESDIPKWQQIISNNFEVFNSDIDSEEMANNVVSEGVWWGRYIEKYPQQE